MRKKDVKIGMKVIPFQKTAYGSLETSVHWRRSCENNQPYLYVSYWNEEECCWALSRIDNAQGGDYFNSWDFEPYIKKKEIKGKLVNTFGNEVYGIIGVKTPLSDVNSKPLYTGDIVSIEDCDTSIVCTSRGDIMGIWGGQQRDIQEFNVKKIKSYSELKKDETCHYAVEIVCDKVEHKVETKGDKININTLTLEQQLKDLQSQIAKVESQIKQSQIKNINEKIGKYKIKKTAEIVGEQYISKDKISLGLNKTEQVNYEITYERKGNKVICKFVNIYDT
jgi:hypothetical protein